MKGILSSLDLVRGHVRKLRRPVRRMALCHGGVHRVDIDNDRVADLREECGSHGGDGGGWANCSRGVEGRSRKDEGWGRGEDSGVRGKETQALGIVD